MKKSFPVNISGHIYYFDEDAYAQLDTYYANLRNAFRGDDGAEIVADIEGRVAEILDESHGDFNPVVTIVEVNDIITRIGRPDELNDEPSHATTTPPPIDTGTCAVSPSPAEEGRRRRLYRNIDNKVIAGVLSGLACYLGCSPTGLRVAVVVLACFTNLWPMVGLYIVAWILIPAAETPRQVLEMNGEQVTVDNVGRRTILGTPNPGQKLLDGSFWSAFGRVVGVAAMGFLGIIGLVLSIGMIITLVMSIIGMVSYIAFDKVFITAGSGSPMYTATALLLTSLAVLVPAASACWAACCTLFKAPGVSRRTTIIVAIIEFLLIVASLSMCLPIDADSFQVVGFGPL